MSSLVEKQHSAKLNTLASIIVFQVHGAEQPPGVCNWLGISPMNNFTLIATSFYCMKIV